MMQTTIERVEENEQMELENDDGIAWILVLVFAIFLALMLLALIILCFVIKNQKKQRQEALVALANTFERRMAA